LACLLISILLCCPVRHGAGAGHAGDSVHALSQLPAYVGSRFGLFREEGLDVQIIQMRTALVGPALISRDLDFATAADTMLRAATTGLPVKVLAFGGIKPALALNVRPEIKKPEDLKGKMISVSSRGSTTDIVARDIVRHFGLNPDTDIITMPLGTRPINWQRSAPVRRRYSRRPTTPLPSARVAGPAVAGIF
jgi:ABC-type nitrate/sulfonate/bicarbonate transport system substrate-binding protein